VAKLIELLPTLLAFAGAVCFALSTAISLWRAL